LWQDKAFKGEILQENGLEDEDGDEKAVNAVLEVENAMIMDSTDMKRKRIANAALARFETKHDCWDIATPAEYDEEELRFCITSNEEDEIERYIKLLHDLQINNWRQLANENPYTLHTKLQDPKIELSEIEEWINKAQIESIDEIMFDIITNEEMIVTLREYGNCGTPKDLSLFLDMPFVLRGVLERHGYKVGDEEVRVWCGRAKFVLERWRWLHDYVTPV